MTKFSLALEGDRPLGEYGRYLDLAEGYGFHSFQIYEHLMFRPAWALAFHLARPGRGIRVGPVTLPVMLTHPAYVAANAAALGEATGGRAVLGISRGAFYEYLSLQVQRPLTALREAVEIIDLLLRGGEGGYAGRVFQLSPGARLRFPGRPGVELYVGSSGPRTIRMASGLEPVAGIVVDNLWNPDYAAKVRGYVDEGARRAGRDPGAIDLIARPFCSIAREGGEARGLALRELAAYLPSLASGSPMLAEAGIDPGDLRAFASRPTGRGEVAEALLANFSAAGTPGEVVEQVGRMVRAGVTHVCFGHPLGPDPLEALRLLGEEVKPHFDEGRGPG